MTIKETLALHDALSFAARVHHGQLRKGSGTDYIIHPCEVLQILTSCGADAPLLLAGVLHDTVEDTGVTLDEIRERYGADTAELVAYTTEDKSKSWQERKLHGIEHAAAADTRQRLLIAADKLSNLRSLVEDHNRLGDELWARFNAGKSHQAWYYGELIGAMDALQNDPVTYDLYWEMVHHFKTLFVKYYLADDVIYETDANSVCALRRDFPQWQMTDANRDFGRGFTLISCDEAEALEEAWYNEWINKKE